MPCCRGGGGRRRRRKREEGGGGEEEGGRGRHCSRKAARERAFLPTYLLRACLPSAFSSPACTGAPAFFFSTSFVCFPTFIPAWCRSLLTPYGGGGALLLPLMPERRFAALRTFFRTIRALSAIVHPAALVVYLYTMTFSTTLYTLTAIEPSCCNRLPAAGFSSVPKDNAHMTPAPGYFYLHSLT